MSGIATTSDCLFEIKFIQLEKQTMATNKKQIFKVLGILVVAGLLIGGAIAFYLFNMPHRDVQDADTDFALNASTLVSEYLADAEVANEKYLAEDGESKILELTGTVAEIGENFDGQKVILLKNETDKAGVSCTFLLTESTRAASISVGETLTVKGVIRSGAAYDEDLEMYEHVILDKCKAK